MKLPLLLPALFFSSALLALDAPAISKEEYLRLATALEAHLDTHIVKPWFPRAVDKERGGFIQDYAEDWTEKRDGNKTIVYQARLTWLAAQMALSFPDKAKEFIEYSNHGLDFLADKMWDAEKGGYFWNVTAEGKSTGERGNEKHVYGISFGLYAASVNYKATKNPKALELAKKTFFWLRAHASDAMYKGYIEALTVAGTPITAVPVDPNKPQSDWIGTRYGYKSMNTHIHLLESFTAYNDAVPDLPNSPDPSALKILQEMIAIVRQQIAVEPGCLNKFFNMDWKPVPDLDSFGHDIETAYLMVEAAEGAKDPDTGTWPQARRIVDHALEFGWDTERGGFYDEGTTFRKVIEKDKVWWVQAEGLNALLLMHEKYGDKNPTYWNAFLKEWEFIKAYQVDAKNGGWISYLGEDGKPSRKDQPKSDQWKDPYHQGRAVINAIERLKKLAAQSGARQ